MTKVAAIIIALSGIHGSKEQCDKITTALIDVVLTQEIVPPVVGKCLLEYRNSSEFKIHPKEDLTMIKNFSVKCKGE